jgi:hypothetical protein
MANSTTKPDGSNIEVIDGFDGCTYRWKPPSRGVIRFCIAAFLAFWLCGWAFFFVSAVVGLVNNANAPKGFLAFWLVAWTLGGTFAIFLLYLLLRPRRPESITLNRDSFRYDSGTPPMTRFIPWYAMQSSNSIGDWLTLFKRRNLIEIAKKELGEVVLERIGGRQQLYFDHGADRVEIGEQLRELEREWLADVIEAWKAT